MNTDNNQTVAATKPTCPCCGEPIEDGQAVEAFHPAYEGQVIHLYCDELPW